MKTIGKAIYAVICLALLAATITAQSQGWTTTFYLAFLAVATPGATMWAWRHLVRAQHGGVRRGRWLSSLSHQTP